MALTGRKCTRVLVGKTMTAKLFRFPLCLVVLLTVCACATPYQEMGLMGGVSATQIDATTIRISARGNAFSDIGSMKDYVLLRAAEETLRHGYSLFYVMDAENVTRTEQFSIPEFHTEPVMGTAIGPNGPVPVFGITTYSTNRSETSTRPGEDIVIKMLNGTKPDTAPVNLYSAAEVAMFLGPKIRGDDDPTLKAAASVPSRQPTQVAPQYGGPPSYAPDRSAAAAAIRACTAEERKIAQMAKEEGFQYHPDCR